MNSNQITNIESVRLAYVRDLKLGDIQRHGSVISPDGFTYTIITNIETVPNRPRYRRITKTSPEGKSYSIIEGLNARIVIVETIGN